MIHVGPQMLATVRKQQKQIYVSVYVVFKAM